MVPPQIGNLAWPQLLSLSSFASPLLSDRPGLGTCPFVCPLNLCRGMGVGGGVKREDLQVGALQTGVTSDTLDFLILH